MEETGQILVRRYLYFTVFASGLTVLGIELSASRLLGAIFGTSNLVWASIIGLILIYLTAGYFIGGWWADRAPYPATLYRVLAWGAFSAGIVPLIARPVLREAAKAFDELAVGVLLGAFSSVLILFILPITLLGTTSPFAIRLAIRMPDEAGRVSGRIYAVSTLGSFVGTFLPDLVLIPWIGTTRTFLVFAFFLLIIALVGLVLMAGWRKFFGLAWMPPVLLVLSLLFGGGEIKQTQGKIIEVESAYNYIQVLEADSFRMLRLNEGQGIHSIWHPTEINYHGPWKQFLAAPYYNTPEINPDQVRRIAIIGLAAGTTARQATAVFGSVPIDGYEIDPEILKIGREYFDMNLSNLSTYAVDGRWGLAHSEQLYSIIGVDAYRPPYIPWHLTTYEFFQIVRDHLDENGVLAINVGRAPNDRRLIDGLTRTIQAVFPSVYVMDVPNTFNSIVYATVQPTRIENLYANLLTLYSKDDAHSLLIDALELAVAYNQPLPETGLVFTDDRAPVEWITNNMVLKFVLFGEMEALQ